MYSLDAYGFMLADRVRVDAYAQALRKTVREGSVVVEIGTGPGAFAVLACQLGAGRVYAIAPGDVSHVRRVGVANDCAGKIGFEVLPARDLPPGRRYLSDLRGILPLFERHIQRRGRTARFLAPGSLIPRMDRLWAAIVEAQIL